MSSTGEEDVQAYLDTANYGLPRGETVEALLEAVGRWETGTSRIDDWISYCDRAREAFARLTGRSAREVACSSTTSHLVGLVATSLRTTEEVLVPEEEFTSNVFPWLAQQDRGVVVRFAPTRDLAHFITPDTSVVAFSLVQSLSGEIADLKAIRTAAQRCGTRMVVDVTQACGWLPFDGRGIDYLVCSLYKWLGAPRGCALMAVDPSRLADLTPNSAGWFAGASILESLYGGPLRLAETARRLDLSPGWISWAGAAAALEHMAGLRIEDVHSNNIGLARRFCSRLGAPPPSSAIVTIPSPVMASQMRAAGVVAANRAGYLRFSFHINNGVEDADLAADVLRDLTPSSIESAYVPL